MDTSKEQPHCCDLTFIDTEAFSTSYMVTYGWVSGLMDVENVESEIGDVRGHPTWVGRESRIHHNATRDILPQVQQPNQV